MTLHIIHLAHRKDRWKTLHQELEDQSITDYKIWPGIEDLDKPSRGVAKAHKQIIQYAKDAQLTSILVAEDDVKFTAPGALDYFLKKEPVEAYDLYLAGISYGKLNTDCQVTDFSGLMLYKIALPFYDTFLSLSEDGHIDRNLKNKGNYFVCYPFAATQHNGFSDNKKAYVNFDTYFKGRKLFESAKNY